MDPESARRARRARMRDLTEAYTDEEASPPEWVELLTEVKAAVAELSEEISRATELFTREADIRRALDRRARFESDARRRIGELNAKIGRLNLLAPHARFTRPALDADAMLRALFRSERRREAT